MLDLASYASPVTACIAGNAIHERLGGEAYLWPGRVQPVSRPHAPLLEGNVDVPQICVPVATPLQVLQA